MRVSPLRLRPRISWFVLPFLALVLAAPAWAISSLTLSAPTGSATYVNLGYAVATAGDFNGDGYADVVVGAPFTATGTAYVYFGGPGADAVADLTFSGEAFADAFGSSVGTAGDVNGDGYADIIVGASGNDGFSTDVGAAYVYFGGPAADATADWTLTGMGTNYLFGLSVGTAGDVNGDGYADVIVGAPYADVSATDTGQAYVYYGGPGRDNTPDVYLPGAAAGDLLGKSVAPAGDVNGDGYDDVVVGAEENDAGGTTAGRAYVYFGGSAMNAVADLTLTGAAAGDYFGCAVGGAGDVNGDGFDDVVVGAYMNDGGGTNAGRAYVFYGGYLPDATADLTLTGAAASDYFGYAVGGAGDVNGDGYDDVVVGAYFNDAGGTNAGRAYVYFGGASPDAVADLMLTGAAASDYFGSAVAGAGDVDGDGFDDVVVGAMLNDAGGTDAGRAYVIAVYPYQVVSPNGGEVWVVGRPAAVRWRGHDPADIALSTNGGYSYVTLAVGVGGDDENEYALVAPATPVTGAMVRVTYTGQSAKHSNSDASDAFFRIVVPETPPPAAERLALTFTGITANSYLGASAGGAGDVNGDGYADAIVGVPKVGSVSPGQALLYFGGPHLGAPGGDAEADLGLDGVSADDRFGCSVGTAGDVNGDGYDDVIVGARRDDTGGANAGRAYVYYGGPSPDASADIAPYGAAASDYFGTVVGTAGDVNGDGYDDFLVGAYANDAGGTDAGRVYVYFGGPALDALADWTLTGETAGDGFGYAASAAGDVNGDGYDDLLVGAYGYYAGSGEEGRAYVYFGGAAPDAVADVVMTGTTVGYFAASVSAAGDVNGDGYGDWMVGSPNLGAGEVGIYLGGPVPDATPDLVLGEGLQYDYFGGALSSAGDVNGDGYGDVLIGAGYNDHAGGDAGRAYVYYGGVPLDDTPDIIVNGEAGGDNAGNAVGAVGDFFGDGFPDFVVGASYGDEGGTDYGSARLYDCNRYFLLSPNDDELWNVGATATVSWRGAEPADLWLSADAGATWQELKRGVGGAALNAVTVQVPHLPTHFARVKVTPSDPSVSGEDRSDSLFTIQSSVALLTFEATLGEGGAELEWSTEPAVSPEGLAGYRLYRLATGATGNGTRVGPELITATRYTDADGRAGMTYRLVAVNGLMQELELGRVSLAPAAPLAAWPLPYRGGALNVSFAVYGVLGAAGGEARVALYDLSGREVRVLANGPQPAGTRTLAWDGTDARGRPVSEGVYFLQARSAGVRHQVKVVVLR